MSLVNVTSSAAAACCAATRVGATAPASAGTRNPRTAATVQPRLRAAYIECSPSKLPGGRPQYYRRRRNDVSLNRRGFLRSSAAVGISTATAACAAAAPDPQGATERPGGDAPRDEGGAVPASIRALRPMTD